MDRRALVVPAETAGERLDRWLATALPGTSRARLKTLIDAGLVRVDGARRKAAHHGRGRFVAARLDAEDGQSLGQRPHRPLVARLSEDH